jgi:hypothetical protein
LIFNLLAIPPSLSVNYMRCHRESSRRTAKFASPHGGINHSMTVRGWMQYRIQPLLVTGPCQLHEPAWVRARIQ